MHQIKFFPIKNRLHNIAMQNNRLLLLALSLAVFGVITTELGIIGLLPELVKTLHVTLTQVGFLVSIYAIVVAISGPFITLLLSGFDKKKVLISILAVFVFSNLMYAVTDALNLMIVFRIIPALFHAVFFAVALVTATSSVPKEKSAGAAAKVFAGVAIGLVIGVPLSTLIAENLSLSAAFLFSAVACFLALTGILFYVPSMPTTDRLSFSNQLSILRSKAVWLAIMMVTFVFSAMFSSFSYIADYLSAITHLNNNCISAMLMVFGVCGLVGNFIFSGLLQNNTVRTTLLYPLFYILIFLIVWEYGHSAMLMCGLIVIWGAFHSSGLLISQTWLMGEASRAPEFANSLYISFSNLGITIGSLTGGWFISRFGTHSLVLSSIIFAVLAFLFIVAGRKSSMTV